jgi:hypothetical protein
MRLADPVRRVPHSAQMRCSILIVGRPAIECKRRNLRFFCTSAPGHVRPATDYTHHTIRRSRVRSAQGLRRAPSELSIWSIIPPRKNAKIKQHGNASAGPLERDECLRQIRRDGRQAWKKSIGYHCRSLAETAMSRIKPAFGDRLKNRELPNQKIEARLRCKLLNWFVVIEMPLFARD